MKAADIIAELSQTLGRRIALLRKRQKRSQEWLAAHADINYRHLQNIEAGKADIKLSTLLKLSVALEVEPTALLVEEQLRGHTDEGFLSMILHHVPCGIQVNDLEGTIIYSNPAHRALHGYSPEEMIGNMKIWDLVASRTERTELAHYFKKLQKGEAKETPYFGMNQKKDGTLVPVRVEWRYLYGAQGQVVGFISAITQDSRTLSPREPAPSVKIAANG